MALQQLLSDLRRDHDFMMNVMAWRTLPAQTAKAVDVPSQLHANVQSALRERGIDRLYSHQAAAVEAALAGENVVVVTPTASGKTLSYNLPILDCLVRDPAARALYLFPTKALAHDQLHELTTWESALNAAIFAAAYDGDTPTNRRATIRKESRIVFSNPDMLHMGILPYHTAWEPFLANLQYVVLDELHSYRGVFGSHVANVLRRLQRLCRLYGSAPQFICTSATIANPAQLATQLLEQPVTLVDKSGAPQGEKHIILYNPPLYDAERGLRRSAVLEAQELATRTLHAHLQTIIFGRSRLTTEILLTYLRERAVSGEWEWEHAQSSSHIRGYRGGYLPTERREIEMGLRDGSVLGVVATNALELGIDIGGLQAAVLCGYPGTIAATWQQMGRAGRTTEGAVAILVATGGLLDQYIIQHPDYIFARSPEHALINPDNLILLIEHLRCALFELPFSMDESFGNCAFTVDALQLLAEQGTVQQRGNYFFWRGDSYPARQVGLRSSGADTVAIQVETYQPDSVQASSTADVDFYVDTPEVEPVRGQEQVRVIGQIDRSSAPLLLHEGAIYIHEGHSYHVRHLDLGQQQATVSPTAVDYYTEVTAETEVHVLSEAERREQSGAIVAHGDLEVRSQVVGYRRIKRFTHENLGVFPLEYPPQLLETSGYWCTITPEVQLQLAAAGQWFDSINDYGPNWQAQRKRVRARDGYRCTQCGRPEANGRQHDVHHLVPFRTFGYVAGVNDYYLAANELSNLVLVCRTCHQRLESSVRVRSGLDGLAYALMNIAPLHLMCDPQDLGVHVLRGDPLRNGTHLAAADFADNPPTTDDALLPTIYLYERIAAGLGFSVRLYELHETLVAAAADLIRVCPCEAGCPACVGPVLDGQQVQLETKKLALSLLQELLAGD